METSKEQLEKEEQDSRKRQELADAFRESVLAVERRAMNKIKVRAARLRLDTRLKAKMEREIKKEFAVK